ncbi:hypothetical protein SASPL_141311 [Salvia splendens]|uniref:Uncharacterized protein n=1 Tax=Salvia splendens TaxID=180675 RepID=A0A8X8WTS9_SALSN|nr:hypothetical protein SASPL_141311 [Salvia splendens]
MAPFITCVNNLSKAITNSTIKVWCVRAYQGFPEDKDDKSLECVFHDSKFRLLMNVKTEMVEVNDHRFLREMFDFKPFAEISQYENVDDSSFFDAIGVITGPGRVISQSKYRLIEIEISDENHNKLFCTIWESNVDLYLDQLKKSEGTIPIVIIQFCKRNLFRGEIHISTHFQASKVVINADVKEVKDFRMKKVHVGYSVKLIQLSATMVNGIFWLVRLVLRRFKFVVNVVDHTSNASLLLWGREGSQLLGRNVTDFLGNGGQVAPKNSIPSLIEEILVVDKYTPKDLGEQIFNFDTRLSDLLFGVDLAEVSQKPYGTTDLSILANDNSSELFVEGSELNFGVEVVEVFLVLRKCLLHLITPLFSNEKIHGWGVEGSAKRCLDLDFDRCDDVDEVQIKKKEKIVGSN